MNNKSLKQQSASYYIDINDNDKSRENDSCNSKWVLVVDSPHRESKEQSLQHKQVFFALLSLFSTLVFGLW